MYKHEFITLKNGLRLLLFQNNKVNRTTASIITFAGSFNTNFNYDGVDYKQVDGIAHFLEHYLIEKSIYGNIFKIFQDDYIETNGYTSFDNTTYYFSTVHDFYPAFIKLLNLVNNPNFDEKEINDVKNPIIEEINRKNDNQYKNYNNAILKSLSYVKTFTKGLGNKEDIKSLTIDDIKLFHDAFYQPNNQLIVISGKFNKNKVIDIIEQEYKGFNKKYKKCIKEEYKEVPYMLKKKTTLKDNLEPLLNVSYKIDTSNLTPLERNMLDYYIYYVLTVNFDSSSSVYNYMIDNKITNNLIYKPYYYMEDHTTLIVEIEVSTDKHKEAEKLIKNTMNNLKINEELFQSYKNAMLVDALNRYENIHNVAKNCLDNYMDLGVFMIDDLGFLKSLNIDDCKKYINNLDLSNVSVCYLIKK